MRHKQAQDGRTFYVVVGPLGAVTTALLDLGTIPRFDGKTVLCAGIDWHSPKPTSQGEDNSHPCEWIESTCYHNGTSLPGVPVEDWFMADDEEAIFGWLESRYPELEALQSGTYWDDDDPTSSDEARARLAVDGLTPEGSGGG